MASHNACVLGHPKFNASTTSHSPELPNPRQSLEVVGTRHTRHHRSPQGLNHRPVQDGGSTQWVDCRLWSYTICQQRPASAMKPGLGSSGRSGTTGSSRYGRATTTVAVSWSCAPPTDSLALAAAPRRGGGGVLAEAQRLRRGGAVASLGGNLTRDDPLDWLSRGRLAHRPSQPRQVAYSPYLVEA